MGTRQSRFVKKEKFVAITSTDGKARLTVSKARDNVFVKKDVFFLQSKIDKLLIFLIELVLSNYRIVYV